MLKQTKINKKSHSPVKENPSPQAWRRDIHNPYNNNNNNNHIQSISQTVINKKNMNNLIETSQDIIRQIIGEKKKERRKSINM